MQKGYSVKDSSISFMLALILPSIFAFVLIFILGIIDKSLITNSTVSKIISTTVSQLSFLAIFFFITKLRKISVKNSLPTSKINFKQILILILIAFSCLFLISPIINVLDEFLIGIGVTAQNLPISLSKPINFVYLLLTLGIFAPICEEFLFRGLILSGLKEKGNKFAILISSLMFVLIHLSLHQTVYQFILGIILAIIVLLSNNIFSAILVHFINNAFVLIINYINPLFFDYNFLSRNYIILAIVLFIFGIFVIFELLKLFKKNCNKNIDDKIKTINKENENIFIKRSNNLYLTIGLIVGVLLWIITVISTI